MNQVYISDNESDTDKIAMSIYNDFIIKKGYKLILLEGNFGSGKTTISKYIIKYYLSKKIEVSSPTFNLLNIYTNNNLSVYHYDFHRLENEIDIIELGIEEALDSSLTLIEWPKISIPYLPQKRLEINLQNNNMRLLIEVKEN